MGPARVLLYTGVRYERQDARPTAFNGPGDDTPQPHDPRASAGRKRRNG
jgi:hypothetical protein